MLDKKPSFTIADNASLAGGVKTLTATGTVLSTGSDGHLQARPATATLIPYYSWCHRGPGRMEVWMACGPEVVEGE